MQKKAKLIILGLISFSLISTGLIISFHICVPKVYGSLMLEFQLRSSDDGSSEILETSDPVHLKLRYNLIERWQKDKHLEFIYYFPDEWFERGNYVGIHLYSNTIKGDHYHIEKIENEVLSTFCTTCVIEGTLVAEIGQYYNFSIWEFGTGPDPNIITK
ncbi:MAG: hypothetical protein BAJALOKI2v1_840016 [Promethearchaeota archaeon]|nr:MAG: hypothetical protein BAJALOKI2v1_840016 [Candidatus Lokiarchaeota archaeon]